MGKRGSYKQNELATHPLNMAASHLQALAQDTTWSGSASHSK